METDRLEFIEAALCELEKEVRAVGMRLRESTSRRTRGSVAAAVAVSLMLLSAYLAFAAKPVLDVETGRLPNVEAAQKLAKIAYARLR